MGEVAAIFDFDGTLSSGHLWTGLRQYFFQYEREKIPLMLAFLATHLPLWLLSTCKLFSEEKCMVKWAEDLNVIFKGSNKEEVLEASRWVIDNYIFELLRKDVVDILNEHKQNGHVVIIVSAGFSDFLQIAGQELGVPNVVGTKLEVVNGRYTGKIIKPVCLGVNKVKLLEEYISQNGLEIDFSSSFAYADSFFDIPLLQRVGNPMATYPGKGLRQFAEHNNWRILS